eukprot:scaffold82862_cov17-Tisochrysis_lutea.AAC.1
MQHMACLCVLMHIASTPGIVRLPVGKDLRQFTAHILKQCSVSATLQCKWDSFMTQTFFCSFLAVSSPSFDESPGLPPQPLADQSGSAARAPCALAGRLQ